MSSNIYANNNIQLNNKVADQWNGTTGLSTKTIPAGTVVFHGSSKYKFNTKNVNLTDKKAAWITDNIGLASNEAGNCALGKGIDGYIHEFKVVKDISNIYVRSILDGVDDLESLREKYCSGANNQYNEHFNGVGFIVPEEKISGNNIQKKNHFQVILCNPKNYLEYRWTYRCMPTGSYSKTPFRIDMT